MTDQPEHHHRFVREKGIWSCECGMASRYARRLPAGSFVLAEWVAST